MSKVINTVAGLLCLCAGAAAQGQIVPLSASRTMNVSLLLDVPGADFVARFDQFEQPAGNALSFMNRGVHVNNEGSIFQQSVTAQSSSLNEMYKLVDARLYGSLTPGQWGRGLNINGQNGLINELYFAARVNSATVIDLATRAYGTMYGGVSMTANVSVYRNGAPIYTFNLTPPSEANSFDTNDHASLTLTPGNYEFFANINGTGRGGIGEQRMGDMTLTFGATTSVPAPAGTLALLGIGAFTILHRRR